MKTAFLAAAIVTCMLLACVALAGTPPAPIYLSANALGGAALNQYTPGVAGGNGANNIGLLIRSYGKVTYVDTINQYFYIDDGSGRTDGTRRSDNNAVVVGVRVSYGGLATGVPAITPPLANTRVAVTGIISTCLVPPTTGLVQPNVRVRSQSDILPLP
jgi:hypothetical protein